MLDGNIDVLELEGQISEYVSLEGELLPIGPKGDKGDDGISPILSVSKTGKRTTITINDAEGTKYAYIDDGIDGTAGGDMLRSVYDKNNSGVVDNAEKVNGKTVEANVPANAKFTDTIYDDTEVRNLINAKPNFSDMPENVSELNNDVNYVSSDGDSTISGENTELKLIGTTKGLFKTFDLKGNTSQNTLSGKNLLPYPYADTTKSLNGITFTDNGDGTITINGTASANTSFRLYGTALDQYEIIGNYISGGITDDIRVQIIHYNPGYTVLGKSTGNAGQIDKSVYTTGYVEIVIQSGTIINTPITIKPMLTLTQDNTYEQYCGGILSPNPNYPQDVNNVSGNNEIVVCGKNLLNIQGIVKGRLDNGVIGYESNTTNLTINTDSFSFTTNANYRGATSDFIKVNGTKYLCSCTAPSTLNIIVACYDGNKNYLRDGGLTYITGHNNQAKITLQNDVAFIRIYFYSSTSGTITIENPQLEEGFEATTYETYNGTTYNIDLPVENLFDKSTISNDTWLLQNGTIETKTDFCTSDYIRVNEQQKYYLPKTNTIRLKYYNSSKQALTNDWDISSGSNDQVITIPTNAYYVRITIQYNVVDINTYQFEKGTKKNTYTPYGTTPIELNKIGTYQDYIAKSTGKNLFDANSNNISYTDAYISHTINGTNKITCTNTYSWARLETILSGLKPSTNYTISTEITNTNGLNCGLWCATGNSDASTNTKFTSKITKLTDSSGNLDFYFYVNYSSTTTSTGTVVFDNIQIEEGSTATEYEPYGNDKWYLHKEIGKIVLDGSETLSAGNINTDSTNTTRVLIGVLANAPSVANFMVLSNQFIGKANWSLDEEGAYTNNNNLVFRINKTSGGTTTDSIKSWFSSHNASIYYGLATPTNTEITDTTLISQLNAIEKAVSYNNQTNINQINNDLPFILNVEAFTDTYNGRYENIQNMCLKALEIE